MGPGLLYIGAGPRFGVHITMPTLSEAWTVLSFHDGGVVK